MRRILVLRGGALGDFVVTLPALGLLRRRWPEAEITLVGNATAAELARARGLLSAVCSQHERRWAGLFGDDALPGDLAGWLGSFDLVLSYWPDPDGALRRRFPCRPEQVFLSAAALPECAPAAAHYCQALLPLGLRPDSYFFPLSPLAPPTRAAAGTIVVHPGSGSPRKNWPAENWRALLRTLPSPTLLVLGEAESAWVESDAPPHCRTLVNPPLETLVAHLAASALFLGHDSGISHLAAACGAPCLLLFGPTDPAVWAPPAPHIRVIRRGPELHSIAVAEVRQAVAEALVR